MHYKRPSLRLFPHSPPLSSAFLHSDHSHGYLTSTHMINKQEVNINQQQQSLAQEAATRQREIEEGMQVGRE